MKKDGRSNVRRERAIMVVSSVFVLAALTAAGVYMRNETKQSKDDGYTIDLQELEERTEDKWKQIADREKSQEKVTIPQEDLEDTPVEAGTDEITLPGITDASEKGEKEKPSPSPKPTAKPDKTHVQDKTEALDGRTEETVNTQEEPSQLTATEPETVTLHFDPAGFTKPVGGQVLIPYSMNSSVYFATLDQYKYHPAVVLSATVGESVGACLEGQVAHIYDSSEYGHMLVLDLGDGYQAVYGQLSDIQVSIGDYVKAGEALGTIGTPTKYYSVEGSNLYFQLLKNKESVDPTPYLQ